MKYSHYNFKIALETCMFIKDYYIIRKTVLYNNQFVLLLIINNPFGSILLYIS